MVVCKFYAQGTCRNGTDCKFEHLQDTNEIGKSIMRGRVSNSVLDKATLVKSVQNDMLNSEKGGQWLLSSYAPFKEKANFPGFEDHSFEEVRYASYLASATGNMDQYKHNFMNCQQIALERIRALQAPNEHAVEILLQIYNNSHDQAVNNSGGTTGFMKEGMAMNCPLLPVGTSNISNSATNTMNPSVNNLPYHQMSAANENIFNSNMGRGESILFPTSAVTTQQKSGVFARAAESYLPNQYDNSSILPSNTNNIVEAQPSSANMFVHTAQKPLSFPAAAHVNSGSSIFGKASSQNTMSCYSKNDSISLEVAKLFQGSEFHFGHIPVLAPLMEFC